jgi:outer membrane protein TolC
MFTSQEEVEKLIKDMQELETQKQAHETQLETQKQALESQLETKNQAIETQKQALQHLNQLLGIHHLPPSSFATPARQTSRVPGLITFLFLLCLIKLSCRC